MDGGGEERKTIHPIQRREVFGYSLQLCVAGAGDHSFLVLLSVSDQRWCRAEWSFLILYSCSYIVHFFTYINVSVQKHYSASGVA